MQKLSNSTKLQFANILRFISETERDSENLKQILVQIPHFNPYDLFIFLDHDEKQYILSDSLLKFCDLYKTLKFPYIFQQFINLYTNNTGLIKYNAFCDLILTNEPALQNLALARPKKYGTFTEKSINSIKNTVKTIIQEEILNYIKICGMIKELFTKFKDFNILDGFCNIDKKATGFINQENLSIFLKQIYQKSHICDPNFIIKRLDFDNDNLISYKEFQNYFQTAYLLDFQTEVKNIAKSPKKPSFESPLKKSPLKSKMLSPTPIIRKINFDSKSPMKSSKISALFELQIRKNKEIENLKKELILQEDFNLVDVFKILFDSQGKGFCSKFNFIAGIKNVGIFADNCEILFNQFSKSKINLEFSEFCEILLPNYDTLLSEKLLEKSSNLSPRNYKKAVTGKLCGKTMILLKLFFDALIDFTQKEYEIVKGFDLSKINYEFSKIDKGNKGYFDIKEFKNFMKSENIPDHYNIEEIFDKFDKNKIGLVKYKDFEEEILKLYYID